MECDTLSIASQRGVPVILVTYRKVYKKMGEMTPINWHNLETRYINKHGKARARRKKIISSNPEMLRKFKNAVDVMLVG